MCCLCRCFCYVRGFGRLCRDIKDHPKTKSSTTETLSYFPLFFCLSDISPGQTQTVLSLIPVPLGVFSRWWEDKSRGNRTMWGQQLRLKTIASSLLDVVYQPFCWRVNKPLRVFTFCACGSKPQSGVKASSVKPLTHHLNSTLIVRQDFHIHHTS